MYHRSLPLVLPFDLLSSVSTRQLTELKFCKLKIIKQPTCEPFDEVQFEAKDWPTDKWRGKLFCCNFICVCNLWIKNDLKSSTFHGEILGDMPSR